MGMKTKVENGSIFLMKKQHRTVDHRGRVTHKLDIFEAIFKNSDEVQLFFET